MSVSIRAPKRKPLAKPVASRTSTPNPVIKREAIEVPIDNKKWSSYILRAGRDSAGDEGTRYNVMRFPSGRPVDPSKDFSKPVRLSRRDLMETPAEADGINSAMAGLAASDKQEYSVAPHAGIDLPQKKGFAKKTHEVYQQDEAVRQLKQEERYPWILEDFDSKNTYQGTLEGGQASTYVYFKLGADGFDIIPVNKFYRFASRARYQTLTLDEAEEKMNKRKALPRWFMKSSIASNESVGGPEAANLPQRQYRMKTTNTQNKQRIKAEEQEEELDYNEDFADDEEQHALVDNEEDNKELEERIKKEMLSANAMGDVDPEVEDEDDATTKARLDKDGRRVQRFLEKLEKNNMYESDSDSNPYGSSSESETEKDAKTSASVSVKGEDDDKKKSLDRLRDEKIRDQVNRLQNTSVTTYNTPNGSALPSRTHSTSNLSNAQAHAKAKRSRPQLVTLRLQPALLAKFSDVPSSAAGDKKRRAGHDGYDSDRSQKKIRFQTGTPAGLSRTNSPIGSRSASGSLAGSRSTTPDPTGGDYLITAPELVSIVRATEGGLSMKGLLKHLKVKLAKEPKNKTLLIGLLKEAGISMTDGRLTVKTA